MTKELEGAALDDAVAARLTLPWPLEIHINLLPARAADPAKPAPAPLELVNHVTDERRPWSPSTDWSQGGPIIERERINLNDRGDCWQAHYNGNWSQFGPTPLIAAMRAFVASRP